MLDSILSGKSQNCALDKGNCKCHKCNKNFVTSVAFRMHEKTHNTEKSKLLSLPKYSRGARLVKAAMVKKDEPVIKDGNSRAVPQVNTLQDKIVEESQSQTQRDMSPEIHDRNAKYVSKNS